MRRLSLQGQAPVALDSLMSTTCWRACGGSESLVLLLGSEAPIFPVPLRVFAMPLRDVSAKVMFRKAQRWTRRWVPVVAHTNQHSSLTKGRRLRQRGALRSKEVHHVSCVVQRQPTVRTCQDACTSFATYVCVERKQRQEATWQGVERVGAP
mmetsp:Transcript_66615/g.97436  ORF Transcript_66615/g.97436 Transcript_66615/m.97436 type:complete len:152 (-) Transcript_66615:35-490(-)